MSSFLAVSSLNATPKTKKTLKASKAKKRKNIPTHRETDVAASRKHVSPRRNVYFWPGARLKMQSKSTSDRLFRHAVFNFAKPLARFLKTSPKPRRNAPCELCAFFLMIFAVSSLHFPTFYRETKTAKIQFRTPFLGSKHRKRIKVSRNEALQRVGILKREISSANAPSHPHVYDHVRSTVPLASVPQKCDFDLYEASVSRDFNQEQGVGVSQPRPAPRPRASGLGSDHQQKYTEVSRNEAFQKVRTAKHEPES